ncbi:unnamed protein product [Protopolystoma xenopodis]|uniref:Dynein heavy chain coiled coil stalk domain-containing protein n=1 Tax=Protopolystoma xenopodis TaxID=117903 RepID=A0A3S4ZLD5_9PLAT|nr:unnamed protein product [Protopolystoma xenopodis]
METAHQLIEGLSGEKQRWTEQSRFLKHQVVEMTGDSILLAAFLTYSGAFNQQFRASLMSGWKHELNRREIPKRENLNPILVLTDQTKVGRIMSLACLHMVTMPTPSLLKDRLIRLLPFSGIVDEEAS